MNYLKYLAIGTSACLCLSNCNKPAEDRADPPAVKPEAPQEAAFLKDIDAAAAADLIKLQRPPIVLDVRTPGEFAGGRIEGATNIDFSDPGFREAVDKLDREQPYLIHCQSGGRSGRSKDVFTELGFTAVYHLDGGMIAWEEAGLPTVK